MTQLDDSYLPIQGPPGAGKTYTGAHMIAELVRSGRKVGVTAVSHKVIENLLDQVVQAAGEPGRVGSALDVRNLGRREGDDLVVVVAAEGRC